MAQELDRTSNAAQARKPHADKEEEARHTGRCLPVDLGRKPRLRPIFLKVGFDALNRNGRPTDM
jgi:hypothetical protein